MTIIPCIIAGVNDSMHNSFDKDFMHNYKCILEGENEFIISIAGDNDFMY